MIYVSGQRWCGSGGCTLLIVESQGSGFKVIGRTSVVQLPIRLLNNTRQGHSNIGVRVQGGGIQSGYEAILSFDGERYPGNPSLAPARRLTGKAVGKTLLSTLQNSILLYGVPSENGQ